MNMNNLCYLCRCLNSNELITINDGAQDIKALIKKHFWFIVIKDEVRPESICSECLTQLTDFHEFYMKVENVHKYLTDGTEYEKAEDASVLETIKAEPLEFLFEDMQEFANSDQRIKDVKKPKKRKNQVNKVKEENHLVDLAKSELSENSEVLEKGKKTAKRIGRKRKEIIKPKKIDKPEKVTVKKKDLDDEYNKFISEYLIITCHVCKEEFPAFSDLKSHCLSTHNERALVKCCDRIFRRRGEIYRHLKAHKNPDKYCVCNICNKKFNNHEIMNSHKKEQHTPDSEKPFACDKCPKRYYFSSHFKQHYERHQEKKLLCPFAIQQSCPYVASNKAAIKIHVKVKHSNEKSVEEYICDICSKICSSLYILRDHQKTHNEKPVKHKCPQCGTYVKFLKTHIKNKHTFSNETCPECNQEFTSKRSLRDHFKQVHKLQRKYNCNYCDKSFKVEIVLKEHIASHTGDYLYSCEYCPKRYNSSANMYRHKKRDHPEEWTLKQQEKLIADSGGDAE